MQCQIVSKIFSVIDLLNVSQSRPIVFNSQVQLYKAEIAFLLQLSQQDELSASQMAINLCITKGAVTQFGDKLCDKALLEKFSKEGNKKQKFYKLTADGNSLVKEYNQMHTDANSSMCEYFSSLSGHDKEVINEFLNKLQQVIPLTKFDCGCADVGGCIAKNT